MTRILSEEVKQAIINDNQLAADFSDELDISIVSLPQMLNRNNKRLTHADAIAWLEKRLNKTLDQLLAVPVQSKTTV